MAEGSHEERQNEADGEEQTTNNQDNREAQHGEGDGSTETPDDLILAQLLLCWLGPAQNHSVGYGTWPGGVFNDFLL